MASAAIRITHPSAARLNQFTAVPPRTCSAMRVPGKATARRFRRAALDCRMLRTLALDDHGEGDDQRVDDQRLDEGETDDHGAAGGGAGARIAGDAFHRRGDGLALSEGTERGSNAEDERGRDVAPVHALGGGGGGGGGRRGRGRIRRLREGRHRDERDEDHHQNSLVHSELLLSLKLRNQCSSAATAPAMYTVVSMMKT